MLITLLDSPFLRNHQLFRWKFPLQFISDENDSIRSSLNFFELFNAMHTIDFGQNLDVGTSGPEKLPDLIDILGRGGKGNSKKINHGLLRDRGNIGDVLSCH